MRSLESANHAFGKVAVLMGGSSAEREVSLMSGAGVLAALQSQGVDAHGFDPAVRGLHELQTEGFARCFIALHGRHGEDGTVQGALELLGIPYTGSGVLASAIAMDKVMTKRVWLTEGLPTPRHVWLAPGKQNAEHTRVVPDELGLPLIVKPPREGSSIGVSKVRGYSDMQSAVQLAAQYDADVLCEEFIDGEEVTCAVIGSGDGSVGTAQHGGWWWVDIRLLENRPALPATALARKVVRSSNRRRGPTWAPGSARS
ncbi:MAG: D-alanine--D-alanine ligase, partial [Burkholderiales bacterium]